MSDKERKEIYSKKALEYSDFYNGKVEIMPKVPIRSLDDFSVWYSPGVAEVSSKIADDEELVSVAKIAESDEEEKVEEADSDSEE